MTCTSLSPAAVAACLVLALLACDPAPVPPANVFGALNRCGNGQVEAGETLANCPGDVCATCTGPECLQKTCGDGQVCTDDACDPVKGCVHLPATGTACSDDQPCLVSPTCQAGKCQGPEGLWHQQSLVDKTMDDEFNAACADGQGGVVVVGGRTESSFQVVQIERTFHRFNAAGKVLAMTTGQGDEHHDHLQAIARLADGKYLAVGMELGLEKPVPGTSYLLWTVLDDEGFVTQPPVLKSSERRSLRALAVSEAGVPMAVGQSDDRGLLARFDKDGKVMHTPREVEPAGAKGSLLHDVAADRTRAAEWLAVGWAEIDGVTQGWLQRVVDPPSTLAPLRLLMPGGLHALAYEVVALPDGHFVVVGLTRKTVVGGPPEDVGLFLVRVDAELEPVWTHHGAVGSSPTGLALVADGGPLLVVSNLAVPDGRKTVLQWFGLDGRLLRQRVEVGPQVGSPVVQPDGFLYLIGALHVSGQLDGVIQRRDAWGHLACAESGACLTQPTGACNDGNACTWDDCQAGGGCVHVTAPDGSPCASGKTCQQGVCS